METRRKSPLILQKLQRIRKKYEDSFLMESYVISYVILLCLANIFKNKLIKRYVLLIWLIIAKKIKY